MTPEQMRELDAYLAEKFMGWHRQRFDNGSMRHNILVPEKFRADKYRKHGWLDGVRLVDSFPMYSSHPAACALVRQKVLKDDHTIVIDIVSDGSYRVNIKQACGGCVTEYGPTEELATCLAIKSMLEKGK